MDQPFPSHDKSPVYIMGHTEREARRLALQGEVINPFTEQLLRRAGVAPGMNVVDFGAGIGDVTLIAARLVGVRGRVTAIERNEQSLEIARKRAEDQGLTNITFLPGDAHAVNAPAAPFDAAIGRLILIHVPDPLKLLERVFGMLRPGGLVVFEEFDLYAPWAAYPAAPLRDEVFQFLSDVIHKSAHASIGFRLIPLLREAGFSQPDCRAEYPVDGDSDSPLYHLLAETVWSLRPHAEALGLARALDLDVDTLAELLREEARMLGSCVSWCPMFGCFARKPFSTLATDDR
jgi:2-polyprenyl-3-methyl-5-hydroxy-6-metoxy-1,4-benzoquinol methylase